MAKRTTSSGKKTTKKVSAVKETKPSDTKLPQSSNAAQKAVARTVDLPVFTPVKKLKTVEMKYGGKDLELDVTCNFGTRGFDNKKVLEWYSLINLGRKLDEKAALYLKMAKGWSYHASFAGHDGIQMALGSIFRQKKDFLFPYYRDMMTSLAAGITPEEIILNGLSKETDIAGGGRHMSNHFAKVEFNIQNVSSCTGNHAQHAAGLARAVKKYGGEEVVYYSGGESACSEGYFWEALNCSNTEKLPVIFVVQNNKYGISVPVHEQTANLIVADNYVGFKNMLILTCDGRCPFNSYRTLEQARDYVLSGKGPALVHADCDRIGSHSNSDPHKLYRSDGEIEASVRRDPMLQLRYWLIKRGVATLEEIEKIEEENKQKVFAAADKAEAAPDADGSKYAEFLLPEPYVKAEDNTDDPSPAKNAKNLSYLEGINTALKEEFRRNPNTFCWGQDVASKEKGGVFNVLKGMLGEFGNKRIFNAPIAENNIVGTANGFTRYRDDIAVVIEGAEFADYFWPAMDQLVEHSHDYWRTKGQYAPRVVIRLASGGYIQGGLYHSQNLEATFTSIPGIRVVSPAFADDAIGLMRNAIRSRGTTMYLEPKFLYNFKPAGSPEPSKDYVVPFGKARLRREGTDVSIISYGSGVHLSLLAANELEKDGISVEVLDLRSLTPLDKESIIETVKKTNRVVIAHEDKMFGGFGGELSAIISEEAFEFLDAPIIRAASKNVPVGFAKNYEDATLLNVNDVKNCVMKAVNF